jgi:hypothetical protein
MWWAYENEPFGIVAVFWMLSAAAVVGTIATYFSARAALFRARRP